jgi:ABC-2 type transport system permease protein
MFIAAGIVLPLAGLEAWSWRPPADGTAAAFFLASMMLAIALAAALTLLANIIVAVTLNERGVNTIMLPVVITLSGSILPLALFPEPLRVALRLLPFAGIVDIPYSLYFGGLAGAEAWAALGLQAFWAAVLIAAGRWALEAAMARLQMQGG